MPAARAPRCCRLGDTAGGLHLRLASASSHQGSAPELRPSWTECRRDNGDDLGLDSISFQLMPEPLAQPGERLRGIEAGSVEMAVDDPLRAVPYRAEQHVDRERGRCDGDAAALPERS